MYPSISVKTFKRKKCTQQFFIKIGRSGKKTVFSKT